MRAGFAVNQVVFRGDNPLRLLDWLQGIAMVGLVYPPNIVPKGNK